MNPEKGWLRLTVRAASLTGGVGGPPQYTQADVARLLQGLARGPFLMGMVRETMDMYSLAELEERLSNEIHDVAREDDWPAGGLDLYWHCRNFAGLAILEVIEPRPDPCKLCKGQGSASIGGTAFVCPGCSGFGGHALTPDMRAERVSIPRSTWRSGWAARYELGFRIASGWSSEAISHLARNLNCH